MEAITGLATRTDDGWDLGEIPIVSSPSRPSASDGDSMSPAYTTSLQDHITSLYNPEQEMEMKDGDSDDDVAGSIIIRVIPTLGQTLMLRRLQGRLKSVQRLQPVVVTIVGRIGEFV